MSGTSSYLKWASLVILVVQNASTILLLRYVRTTTGDMFYSTTAIVCQEIIKMSVALVLLFSETMDFNEFKASIQRQILDNKIDSIKTGVPAFLFTIQTNLVYLAISNLDAAVFQVTFQLKILTTALFTVLMLKRSLRLLQWVSLVILVTGISIIQIQNASSSSAGDENKNAVFGLFCVISACLLSGLAGVYFEKILKNSKVSIWIRNIQLGMFGAFFALVTAGISDGKKIQENGFFFGYTSLVWLNIVIQSSGGLLVAVVIKYADNILKGFATSVAIIVSCIASVYLFGTIIDMMFAFGTCLVIVSVIMYSYTPPSAGVKLPSLSSPSDEKSLIPGRSSFDKIMVKSEQLIKYNIGNQNVVSNDDIKNSDKSDSGV